jgi:hypothetical protein
MYHRLIIRIGAGGLEFFQSYFQNYLSAIRSVKNEGASHAYLRWVFIDSARKSFSVDPVDVELGKGIEGAMLRGSFRNYEGRGIP